MTMKGLITVNKLIEMLLQEVETFDFNKYQGILLSKTRITEDIRKKRASISDINNLATEIIPAQRRIMLYYTERIPRIEKIINILNKSKPKFSKPSILRRTFSLFSRKKSITSNLHKDEYIHILELLKNILIATGNEVLTADNGKDGLSLILSERFDLIILDITMPEFSGIDIVRYLNNNERLDENNILFLTAASIPDSELQEWLVWQLLVLQGCVL